MGHTLGLAWYRHQQQQGSTLRLFLRGWFTPLHGTVIDTDRTRVCIQVPNHLPKWVCVVGKKNEVASVEVVAE
jgi:hypothetical protein